MTPNLEHLELTDTQTIVLDEADTLFGVETYRQQIMHIVYLCRKVGTTSFGTHLQVSRLYATAGTKARIQYIWVSATVSKEVASYISKEFPVRSIFSYLPFHLLSDTTLGRCTNVL